MVPYHGSVDLNWTTWGFIWAVVAVVLAVVYFLTAGVHEAGLARATERCAAAWSPRPAQFINRKGCIVHIDGQWWPERNVRVTITGGTE